MVCHGLGKSVVKVPHVCRLGIPTSDNIRQGQEVSQQAMASYVYPPDSDSVLHNSLPPPS